MADSLPHTAITSWSGFVYQGKVAILHCIKLLTQRNHVADLQLQLDSVEDFAIISNGSFQSVHQVKAKRADTLGSYANDFRKLVGKAADSGCSEAYFHVSVKLRYDQEEMDSYKPAELYDYGGRTWCSLDQIDRSIVEALVRYYQTHFPDDDWKHDEFCTKKILPRLELLIASNVILTHSLVQTGKMKATEAAYKNVIPFASIKKILVDDHNDPNDELYFLDQLKLCFNKYYEKYCHEEDLKMSNREEFDKLSTYILFINSLSGKALVKFYQTILPHRDFRFKTVNQFKDNTFTQNEIRFAFFSILRSLQVGELADHAIRWYKASKIYWPTAISSHPDFCQKVCKDIVDNFHLDDVKMLFNCDCLITYAIKAESVHQSALHLIDSHESESSILDVKKMSLVPLSEAEGIING